jgi:hypothetical protein
MEKSKIKKEIIGYNLEWYEGCWCVRRGYRKLR